jgi:hypothetical protein
VGRSALSLQHIPLSPDQSPGLRLIFGRIQILDHFYQFFYIDKKGTVVHENCDYWQRCCGDFGGSFDSGI